MNMNIAHTSFYRWCRTAVGESRKNKECKHIMYNHVCIRQWYKKHHKDHPDIKCKEKYSYTSAERAKKKR